MSANDRKPDWAIWAVFAGSLGLWIVWALWLADWLRLAIHKSNADLTSAGQFGDLFGGINALFTALAFAAVWWTGRMQRAELALQREELKLQREELTETRGVFETQLFESTYFNQIDLIRKLLSEFVFIENEGVHAVAAIGRVLRRRVGELSSTSSNLDEFRWRLNEYYVDSFYKEYEPNIGPLMRSLYQLYKLIDIQASMPPEEKIYYANLARSQLNSDVLTLVAVNCQCDPGAGFVDYIERYTLLKHLPNFLGEPSLRQLYNPSAFMRGAVRSVPT